MISICLKNFTSLLWIGKVETTSEFNVDFWSVGGRP